MPPIPQFTGWRNGGQFLGMGRMGGLGSSHCRPLVSIRPRTRIGGWRASGLVRLRWRGGSALFGVVAFLAAFCSDYHRGNDHTDKGKSNDEVMHSKFPRAASVRPHLQELSGAREKYPIQLNRDVFQKVLKRDGPFLVRGDGNLWRETLNDALIWPTKCVNVHETWVHETWVHETWAKETCAEEICRDGPGGGRLRLLLLRAPFHEQPCQIA